MPCTGFEIHHLFQGLAICQRYEPEVKAELFSTALTADAGLFLIDPIALDAASLSELTAGRDPKGIIVTNENHVRGSLAIARRLTVPIYAHPDAGITTALSVLDPATISPDIEVTPLPGAPRGEVALLCGREGGTLIMGDALINFGSHGFTLLPAKYCSDAKMMLRSLQQLLELRFERILFAHGTPIVTNARARLAALLEEQR